MNSLEKIELLLKKRKLIKKVKFSCFIFFFFFLVISTVPQVAFAMQSCTNVAKTDDRFAPSYLVKYSAGNDEKVIIRFRGNEAQNLEVIDGQINNLKITGQQIINSKLNKESQGITIFLYD